MSRNRKREVYMDGNSVYQELACFRAVLIFVAG
jgi:hypothetical protein